MEVLLAMIGVRHVAPADIHRETLDGGAAGGPEGGELRIVRFPPCGVALLVPNAPRGRIPGWLPEPVGPWWRRVRRWMRGYAGIERLAAEVAGMGRRRRSPLFCVAAAGLTRWAPVVAGSKVGLDAYIEYVVPDEPPWVGAAVEFLRTWVDTFGALCWSAAEVPAVPSSALDSLCAVPSPTVDSGLSQRCIAGCELLAGVVDGPSASRQRLPFPNLLRNLWPVEPSDAAARDWDAVLDTRVSVLERRLDPRDYPPIQALLAHDGFAREFVGEADPAGAHGRSLVGEVAIRRLHAIGRRMEAAYPVLAVDPFAALEPPGGA